MNENQQAAYIMAQAAGLNAEVAGMQAENAARIQEGKALAYGDGDFDAAAHKYYVDHNQVIEFFRR